MTTLSAQDVRALRNADSLCFDHRDNQGCIRAILRGDHTSTGFEQTHYVYVNSRVRDFHPETGDTYTAFAMIHSAQFDSVMRTILRHLNTGTQVQLEWTRGNSSPVTDKHNIVRDELRIIAQRPNAKHADVYLVQVSVGEDNTARMVRLA